MMKKLCLAVVVLVACASPAFAQWTYAGYAQITVDNTTGGVGFPSTILTNTGHQYPTQAFCFVESQDIRWTVDGTAPTTTVGNVATAGSALPAINGSDLLGAFRAIRDGGSNGALSCNFFSGGLTQSPLSAGSGGGGSGGGGGSVTQGTTPWIVAGQEAGAAVNVICTSGCGGSGGTAMVDDAAFTPGTTSITPAGAFFDDVAPDSVNEGDGGVVRMSANRNMYTTIRDAAGNERGANVDASSRLTTAPTLVSGSVASGAVASGAYASGAIASGAVASGAFASGSIASGAIAAGAIANGATAIAENEDVASADADRGVKIMFKRLDTPANASGTDGDYEQPQMSAGRIWTSTAGNLANDGAAAGTNRIGTLPGVVQNSAPSLTDGRNAAMSLTTGGAARVMITNSAGAASTIATDSTNDSAASTTGPQVMAMAEATTPSAVSDGDSVRMWADLVGALKTASAYDPCGSGVKTVIPINISTATTTELTPSLAGASNNYYVCSLNLGPTSAAQNFALVDDDSDNCGSVTSGLAGGTTAGSGWNFAANGGLTMGNGLGTIFKTNGTNRVICAVTSASAQISGAITVVAAP